VSQSADLAEAVNELIYEIAALKQEEQKHEAQVQSLQKEYAKVQLLIGAEQDKHSETYYRLQEETRTLEKEQKALQRNLERILEGMEVKNEQIKYKGTLQRMLFKTSIRSKTDLYEKGIPQFLHYVWDFYLPLIIGVFAIFSLVLRGYKPHNYDFPFGVWL
jgi:predicted  nucleic acid-binding Zn-ribbon protein